MNDEEETEFILELELELEALRVEHNGLQEAYRKTLDRIEELEGVKMAPAGNAELQAQAATFCTAQRNGHPDAPKHLEKLLGMLGAA